MSKKGCGEWLRMCHLVSRIQYSFDVYLCKERSVWVQMRAIPKLLRYLLTETEKKRIAILKL